MRTMELNEVIMNQRGMITIPTKIRKKHQFKSGGKFYVIDYGDQIILIPKISDTEFNSNKIDDQKLIDSLYEDAERELELEKS